MEAADEILDLRLRIRRPKTENVKIRLLNKEMRTLHDQLGSAAEAVETPVRSTLELLIAPCQKDINAVAMGELRKLLAPRCETTQKLAQVSMTDFFGKLNEKRKKWWEILGNDRQRRRKRCRVYMRCFPGSAGKQPVALSPLGEQLSANMMDSTRPIFQNVRLRRKTVVAPAPTIAEVAEALQTVLLAEEAGYAFGFSDDDSSPGSMDQLADKPTCLVDNSQPEQPLVWWKCACSSGLDLREQPDVHSAPAPGVFISQGDCFLVSQEQQGADGVLYLRLHKSGLPWEADSSAHSPPPLWAFDRLPGAQEPMAVRYLQL